MGFNRIFAEEAENEVRNILNESKSPKEQKNFVDTFDKNLDLLDEFPDLGKNTYKDYQVFNFVKLPFKFVYKIVKDNTLFVLAVFHKKRDSNFWKDRADNYKK
jgi:plasmid stabilization system protein ParE